MHTFWQTARFELRYHLRQPVFYLFYALMVAQGFFYGLNVLNEELAGPPNSAVASLIVSVFSTVGVLLTALAALLAGQSLLRDRTYRVGDYLYALPLDERLYFAGKLTGVLGTCLVLATGVGLGVLVIPLWTAVPAGPFPLSVLLLSFFMLLAPNLLIVVSLAYALTAFTQRMTGAYLTLLGLVVSQVLFSIGELTVLNNDLLLLLDPFGHVLVRDAVSQQTPDGQLAGLFPFPDLLLINRLLWLGLSGGLLVRAADRLTFQHWASRDSNRAERDTPGEKTPPGYWPFPVVHRQFTDPARGQLLLQLARRDFRYVVRQPAFGVVALLLVLTILGYATGLGNLNETGQRLLPFTSRMTYIRLPLLLFIGLFLSVFSGELLHRERSSGLWPLVDVVPQPGWLLLLAKYGAMLGVAVLLTGTLFLTGLTVQFLNGQTSIDWQLYAADLLVDGLLRYAQLLALIFPVQTLIANRLAGQLASATVVALLLAVDRTGLNGSWLAVYSGLPHSWTYSELTGYGRAGLVRWVYAAMWSVTALGLLLLATGLGQRGVLVPIRVIGQRWRSLLRPGYVIWLAAVAMGVFVSQLYLRFPANKLGAPNETGVNVPVIYHRTTQRVSVQNRPVTIQYQYVHEQNLARLQAIVTQTFTQGTGWLGTFPASELTIAEVPFNQPLHQTPNRIEISERDGWLTDTSEPADAGQFDLSIARTLLRHWIGQKAIDDASMNQNLPDYLALRVVQQQRGDNWLATELARLQRASRKTGKQGNIPGPDPTLSASRGPLSLTCIGEVWGHDRLCRQIGQFVQQSGNAGPQPFSRRLASVLPDSLTYLATYLTQSPSFDLRLGQVGQYPDRLSVRIHARKHITDSAGTLQEQLLNDYIPVVLLNATGQVVYRQLVRVGTDGRTDKVDWLPNHPDAVAVAIDPLGTWPELNKRDNRKQLARL